MEMIPVFWILLTMYFVLDYIVEVGEKREKFKFRIFLARLLFWPYFAVKLMIKHW